MKRVNDAHMPGSSGWDSGSSALQIPRQSCATKTRLSTDAWQSRPKWTELRIWTNPEKVWGCRAKQTIRVRQDVPIRGQNFDFPIAGSGGDGSGLVSQTLPQQAGTHSNHGHNTHPALSFLPLNVYLGETVRHPRIHPPSGIDPRARRQRNSKGRVDDERNGIHQPGNSHGAHIDGKPSVTGETASHLDPASSTTSHSRQFGPALFKTCLWLGLILIAVSIFVGARHVSRLNNQLPVLPSNPAASLPQTSLILASDGSQIGTLFGDRRTWIPFQEMSPDVINALIAAEDHRYFEHNGIDLYRVVGAFWKTRQGNPEGASTIPMQLARNFFPEIKQHSLVDRKIEELLLARRINRTFSKEETLEWYLNTVAFGHNSFGIEAAAERFYATDAASLTLSQASLLVGILQGPSKYDPFARPDNARARRDVVLVRMAQLGMISQIRLASTREKPIGLNPVYFDPAESIAPHFLDFVKREARAWADRAGFDLRSDGLVIHTSIDPNLQRIATASVVRQTKNLQSVIAREFGAPGSIANERFWRMRRNVEDDHIRKSEPFRVLKDAGRSDQEALLSIRRDATFLREIRNRASQLQAGFVAMDPHSGQIKAWVGGTDYRTGQFDKVASAKRQPGSVFKPILYAEALERGYSPYFLVEDRIKTFSTNTRGERWTPTNSGGGASGRLVTLQQGLAWSKNTVSAHLISRIGPRAVVDRAKAMGITSSLLAVPSLALGTGETSLLEMVNVYATLGDHGIRRNVTAITSISDRDGNIVATFPSEPDRVLSEQTSHTMLDMMRDVIDGGTGGLIRSRFHVKGEIAGKTGTTQNNADGWFIAIHPDLVVGAWVGFNDQRVTFQSNYWGQGGHNALLLVGDFLRDAGKGPGALLKPSRFNVPIGYRAPVPPVYSLTKQRVAGKEEGASEGSTKEMRERTTVPSARTPITIPTGRRPIGLRTRFTPSSSSSDS